MSNKYIWRLQSNLKKEVTRKSDKGENRNLPGTEQGTHCRWFVPTSSWLPFTSPMGFLSGAAKETSETRLSQPNHITARHPWGYWVMELNQLPASPRVGRKKSWKALTDHVRVVQGDFVHRRRQAFVYGRTAIRFRFRRKYSVQYCVLDGSAGTDGVRCLNVTSR